LVLVAGCPGRRLEDRSAGAIGASPAKADRGLCADVADARLCWLEKEVDGKGCAAMPGGGAVCVHERPVPKGPRPTAGWRCSGDGKARTCIDRGLGGGPFVCERKRCTQTYPRMPDDGEWECIDMDGTVMCRRGVPAAAVVVGKPDVGWMCGDRITEEGKERVCVDFSPDLPDGATRGWRCRYDHKRRERKICRESDRDPGLLSACDANAPCPDTLACAGARCVPRAPRVVSCWFDKECENGQECHLATCVEGDGK